MPFLVTYFLPNTMHQCAFGYNKHILYSICLELYNEDNFNAIDGFQQQPRSQLFRRFLSFDDLIEVRTGFDGLKFLF